MRNGTSKVARCHELLEETCWHDHDDCTKQRGCQDLSRSRHPTQLAILRAISKMRTREQLIWLSMAVGHPFTRYHSVFCAGSGLWPAGSGFWMPTETQVANAMRAHPKYVSGTRRGEFGTPSHTRPDRKVRSGGGLHD